MTLLVDHMCGDIVVYCRLCGYDTVYAGDRDLEADDAVLAVAAEDERVLITRDVDLAGRADESILLRTRDVEDQLSELAAAGIDLSLAADPEFCGRCNGPLDAVPESAPTPEYAPDPRSIDVWQCKRCGQHFWRGSHWDRVSETLAAIDRDARD